MNRSPEDTKYVFRPPKYSRFWASIVFPLADLNFRKRAQKVMEIRVVGGADRLENIYKKGDSILIAPNHSDHCDPLALINATKKMDIILHFMAAREIFDKHHGWYGFLMQRLGVFSVDREGADLSAIKEAMRILQEARYPLVIFPEGEIYHLNERLTPLNEGAATLALKAAQRIHKENKDKAAWIIPAAIKYNYIEDISGGFSDRMTALEQSIKWAPQTDLDIVERIYKFGEALLSLKEKEFFNHTLDGTLCERLQKFREILIAGEEELYFSKAEKGEHPQRTRKLRGKIRAILLDEKNPADAATSKQCYKSLDRLYVAIQSYSYPGQYLREKRSMNRIAETLHKFEEDMFNKNVIQGKRVVEITFCEPINLMDHLDAYAKDPKSAVSDITAQIEASIRNILE